MSIFVTVKARLKDDPDKIKDFHDQVVGATKDVAKSAGDISHKIYLSASNPRDFLGVDVWKSAEAFQKFSSDPRIREFFGQLFEGSPEVNIWEETGWNQW